VHIRFNKVNAEDLAVRALGWLAGDMERLSGFFAVTGLDPSTIRSAVTNDGFFLGVLDHLLSDESLLMAFAADQGLDPAAIAAARAKLAPAHEEGLREG
jgi:hypothetical protein